MKREIFEVADSVIDDFLDLNLSCEDLEEKLNITISDNKPLSSLYLKGKENGKFVSLSEMDFHQSLKELRENEESAFVKISNKIKDKSIITLDDEEEFFKEIKEATGNSGYPYNYYSYGNSFAFTFLAFFLNRGIKEMNRKYEVQERDYVLHGGNETSKDLVNYLALVVLNSDSFRIKQNAESFMNEVDSEIFEIDILRRLTKFIKSRSKAAPLPGSRATIIDRFKNNPAFLRKEIRDSVEYQHYEWREPSFIEFMQKDTEEFIKTIVRAYNSFSKRKTNKKEEIMAKELAAIERYMNRKNLSILNYTELFGPKMKTTILRAVIS